MYTYMINFTDFGKTGVQKGYSNSWLPYHIYFGKHDTQQQIFHVNDIIILHQMCGFGITSNSVTVVTGSIDSDQDKSM